MTSSVTSDRDYLEIAFNDSVAVSATSIGGDADGVFPQTVAPGDYSGSVPITHNLGVIPMVRSFYDSDKNGCLYNTIRWTTGDYLAIVSAPMLLTLSTTTTTKLIINSVSSASNIPVFYRIYNFGGKGLTSDSTIDKIFDKDTDFKTLSAASDSLDPVLATNAILHDQGEQIFWTLEFSDDQTNWYKAGVPVFGAADTSSGPPGGPYARYYYFTAYGSADATNFYVTYVHNSPGTKTIYTRYVLDYIN